MKLIHGFVALALSLASARAQEPDPSPATDEAAPPAPSSPTLSLNEAEEPATAVSSATPASTEQLSEPVPAPEPPSADSAKMKEEVNLSETPTAEDFNITAPADEPDADAAPKVTGKLEGDEPATPRPEVTGTIEVTAQDQNRIVRAAVGNLIRITLESNPSTGYNWELRDFDFGVAVFHTSDLVARDNGGNVLFGAPGDTVITLQAVKLGTQDITLVYRRQWEPPDQVAQTFSFKLEVADETSAPDTAPAP
jgi:predicted secreted protein